MQLIFRDNTSAMIGTFVTYIADQGPGWKRYSVTGTAPANTVRVDFRIVQVTLNDARRRRGEHRHVLPAAREGPEPHELHPDDNHAVTRDARQRDLPDACRAARRRDHRRRRRRAAMEQHHHEQPQQHRRHHAHRAPNNGMSLYRNAAKAMGYEVTDSTGASRYGQTSWATVADFAPGVDVVRRERTDSSTSGAPAARTRAPRRRSTNDVTGYGPLVVLGRYHTAGSNPAQGWVHRFVVIPVRDHRRRSRVAARQAAARRRRRRTAPQDPHRIRRCERMAIRRATQLDVTFPMWDSTDPTKLKAGLTVAVTITKDAGNGAASTNAVAEVTGAAGTYRLRLTAAETDAELITLKATATGACDQVFTVAPENPNLANLDATVSSAKASADAAKGSADTAATNANNASANAWGAWQDADCRQAAGG